MNTLERLTGKIKRIDYLIKSKSATSLKQLARKLNLSTRQVKNYIHLMRELGAPIEYDQRVKKFYFSENKNITIKYE